MYQLLILLAIVAVIIAIITIVKKWREGYKNDVPLILKYDNCEPLCKKDQIPEVDREFCFHCKVRECQVDWDNCYLAKCKECTEIFHKYGAIEYRECLEKCDHQQCVDTYFNCADNVRV